MAKRGVLYIHWGSNREVLDRSISSLKAVHPELPVHVEKLPDTATLLDKARMFDLSPFEETCFLDQDTVVLGRLDFGFRQASCHGLACCICENPWARRYSGLKKHLNLIEYNTGVLFWNNQHPTDPGLLFREWRELTKRVDSSIVFHGLNRELFRMPLNDQAAFAVAVDRWGPTPAVLPLNWNFRPAWHRSWWGPIVIWHDYSAPPANVLEFTAQQQQPGAIIEYRVLQ